MDKIMIHLTVNGVDYNIEIEPNQTLLNFLRHELGVSSVKDACGGEGECGACSVIMDGKLINSCLVLAGQADGRQVVTLEGTAHDDHLHLLQQAFLETGAVQCGYCTPGMLLSSLYLLDHNPEPTAEAIRDALAGNLCRCTGYRKIIEAVQSVSMELMHDC